MVGSDLVALLFGVFLALNRPNMDEETMETVVECIVNGLFAACVTLGVVPIIQAPRGNCAEQVAEVCCGEENVGKLLTLFAASRQEDS